METKQQPENFINHSCLVAASMSRIWQIFAFNWLQNWLFLTYFSYANARKTNGCETFGIEIKPRRDQYTRSISTSWLSTILLEKNCVRVKINRNFAKFSCDILFLCEFLCARNLLEESKVLTYECDHNHRYTQKCEHALSTLRRRTPIESEKRISIFEALFKTTFHIYINTLKCMLPPRNQ